MRLARTLLGGGATLALVLDAPAVFSGALPAPQRQLPAARAVARISAGHITSTGGAWSLADQVARNEPVVLVGAANAWPAVGHSLKWLVAHFPDPVFFDVGPLPAGRPLGAAGNFTFVPYYGGHGYALEDLCSGSNSATKHASDGVDGATPPFSPTPSLTSSSALNSAVSSSLGSSPDLAPGFCRGSGHTHVRRPLDALLGPRLAGSSAQSVMFAKLGPHQLPPRLRERLLGNGLGRFLLPHGQHGGSDDLAREGTGNENENNGEDFVDLDLWMGDGGWTSATHYDLQHNAYAQLVGAKRVVLAPPFLEPTPLKPGNDTSVGVVGGGIVSHLHPRHRQTFDVVTEGAPGTLSTVIHAGDVLFIPALWLHTFTALEPSASVALCSPSAAHAAAVALEALPLPLELNWPVDRRGRVLAAYLQELVVAFGLASLPAGVRDGVINDSIHPGAAFARHLVRTRHRNLFLPMPVEDEEDTEVGCAASAVVLAALRDVAGKPARVKHGSSGGSGSGVRVESRRVPLFTAACVAPAVLPQGPPPDVLPEAPACEAAAPQTPLDPQDDEGGGVLLNAAKLRTRAAEAAAAVLPKVPDAASRRLVLQNFAETAGAFVFGSGTGGVAFLATCAAACPMDPPRAAAV